MALKTYLPTLLVILRHLCSYIGNHREKIIQFVGEDNAAAVDAVVAACEILTDILLTVIPIPT